MSVRKAPRSSDLHAAALRNRFPRRQKASSMLLCWLFFIAVWNESTLSTKVIVKLANIVLTPERPKYKGGAWHVEGMENEKIVATGIYYGQSQNVTSAYLAFRRAVAAPEYCQDDNRGVEEMYGLVNHKPQ